MNLHDLEIGYVPFTADMNMPGDRRRFVGFAKSRGIPIQSASPEKSYDVVIVSSAGDISVWSRWNRGRIIYDLTDAYLSVERNNLKNLCRGLAKFVVRDNRRLVLDYQKGLQAMCSHANAVVCTTEEQEREIRAFCPNVHRILDIPDEQLGPPKNDYSAGPVFNLVWEGLPENAGLLRIIAPALETIAERYSICVHIITKLRFEQYMRRFVRRDTRGTLPRIPGVSTYLYEYNLQVEGSIIRACDIALIPIPHTDRLRAGKPENKLLLFWRLGMPVIASATPAYQRAMNAAGVVDMACNSQHDWIEALERYLSSAALRQQAGESGYRYAIQHHGTPEICAKWERALTSAVN
jgi:glycosyltransferase involved in cell wall biosynthesis